MRRAELTGWAPWVFCAAVLVMAGLTFARPETFPFSLFVVPVLACSVLGRRALTVLVASSDVAVEGSRAARLAEGLAGLAEGLGLSTVAEGVETIEQARALHHLGWMFGQGWHFGRAAPLPTA